MGKVVCRMSSRIEAKIRTGEDCKRKLRASLEAGKVTMCSVFSVSAVEQKLVLHQALYFYKGISYSVFKFHWKFIITL